MKYFRKSKAQSMWGQQAAKSSKILSKILFCCLCARYSTSLHSGGSFWTWKFRKH